MRNTEQELPNALARPLRDGRLPHALLITGPQQTGLQAAQRLAKALLCEQPVEGLACGNCNACLAFDAGANPDYLPVRGDKTVKVEQIRSLRQTAPLRPLSGTRRVALIEAADSMTHQAQNALLKLLEEPPPHLTIVLQARHAPALLDTVRSRATTCALDWPVEEYAMAKQAAQALEHLLSGNDAALLALLPAIADCREDFSSFCDALCALCHAALAGRAGLAAQGGAFTHRLPSRLAVQLPKIAASHRAQADGSTNLTLLAADLLLECWEVQH